MNNIFNPEHTLFQFYDVSQPWGSIFFEKKNMPILYFWLCLKLHTNVLFILSDWYSCGAYSILQCSVVILKISFEGFGIDHTLTQSYLSLGQRGLGFYFNTGHNSRNITKFPVCDFMQNFLLHIQPHSLKVNVGDREKKDFDCLGRDVSQIFCNKVWLSKPQRFHLQNSIQKKTHSSTVCTSCSATLTEMALTQRDLANIFLNRLYNVWS